MEASEVFYTLPAMNATTAALSTEMSLTPTPQTIKTAAALKSSTPPPVPPRLAISSNSIPTTPTTPRTTTHTPREIPTMYILDQMYDDYMDQYNGNNITTPTETPETNTSIELAPCPICSRTFNPVTLRKHVGICEKMATKKRNIFDSSRQRREGTDLASYPLPKNFGLPDKANSSNTSLPAARGDRGHSPRPPAAQVSSPILARKKPTEDLIRSTARASMRKSVNTTNAASTAAGATTLSNFTRDRMRSSERSLTRRGIQPLPAEQCPHCERCFGIKAYDRHVEWCKEKALQASIKQGSSKNDGNIAKARLEARIKYRAPCLKTKRSINREKYSGLANEEQENDENSSKCSKDSSNKTQDMSLMSMSMTSSMCSERAIMNPTTTGNINEPATPPTTETTAKYSKRPSSIGSQKCAGEKNPIQKQTPTTRKNLITTSPSSPTGAVVAAALEYNEDEDEEENEPFINHEIEMPEFYLMGEQMTSNAINKRQLEKATTTRTTRAININKTKLDILSMAKMKAKQQEPQQKQQHSIEDNEEEQINSEFNRNSKLPTDLQIKFRESFTYEKKKSPSDLSLDSMHHNATKNLPQKSYKSFKSDNDNQDHNQDALKSKVNLDLSTSVIFSNSQNDLVKKAISKKNSQSKKKQANISEPKDFIKNNVENIKSARSKTIRAEICEIIANPSQDKADCSMIVGKRLLVTEEKDENLNNFLDGTQSDYQFENVNELNIPTAVPFPTKVVTTPSFGNEKETYKDCLTDSDERRRTSSLQALEDTTKQTAKSIMTSSFNETKHEMLNTEVTMKNSLNSDTFKEDLPNNCNEHLISSGLKSLPNKCSRLKCSAKGIKSLKLQRLPSPPPKLSRIVQTSQHNLTFLADNQPEINYIKSLNMCQPKRRKVLRQTVSCSNTLPMKAVHLSQEYLEVYNVSSAPQIKASKTNRLNNENGVVEEDCNSASEDGGVSSFDEEKKIDIEEKDEETSRVEDKEIKVIKEPPQLKRNRSFTVSGLPDNYDPFLSAKRQLEELCSTTANDVDISPTTTTATTAHTTNLPSLPTTPNTSKTMSTSLILSSSTPNQMTTSPTPQQSQKTPILGRSSSFRRTSSLRGPRRSPLLAPRPPLFAQKQRPTIQRGLSDEGPISTNFLKPEEYDEMPVRSVCVNDFALNRSPRVVRRDTSASNRKQPLKININAANANSSSATGSPNITEPKPSLEETTSKYVSKTDSLAVFLKYERELDKLNKAAGGINEIKRENSESTKTQSSTASPINTPLANVDGPLNAKELKDKSNNLSKQNSAKNIKADILEIISNSTENYENANKADSVNATADINKEIPKYAHVRLAPLETKPLTKPSSLLSKPNTPPQANKPSTPQQQQALFPASTATSQENRAPNPVTLSSIFDSDNKTNNTRKQQSSLHSNLLYTERKKSIGSDYIDPKLINKCDNLPINLNLKRLDLKQSDSDASETRMEQFSSSSSESSAPVTNKSNSLMQHTTFLPLVRQQQQPEMQQQQQEQQDQNNKQNIISSSVTNNQRNSAEGRNLLKRRMRLGRNQFLYDASPEGDSCSADDEGANRSSMECESKHRTLLRREHDNVFEHLSPAQANPSDAATPFIPPPPLPVFDDFDFEEFLSSFENDEEQFPIFKDCREFLLNRTSKKQRSMLMSNSVAQNTTNNTNANANNSTNFKKSPSPQTFPPLTPQSHATTPQHFQFPTLPQQPKNQFNPFSLNNRTKNKYDELMATTNRSNDATFAFQTNSEDYKDIDNHQKREIFISIETEQNDLDKSPISPNSIRNMVGNPQTVVEVEVDAVNDNKFSKISDDDTDNAQQHTGRCNSNFPNHLEHLPNVQLNNAKNLMQNMHEGIRQIGDEMSANLRLTTEHRTMPVDVKINSNTKISTTRNVMAKANRATGMPSGDAYADSDELSSLDGYPLSSPNSRLGVSSKMSADSAYGSLSRQRSSELTSQRSSSRSRPMVSTTANTLYNRPLTEESSLGRSRQLSASSSSSSEHVLPPITKSNSYHKQHHQQQQQHYSGNNNNELEDLMLYERNNNNYDVLHPTTTTTGSTRTNSQTNLESLQQYNISNSTMSTSMKMSRFCHECGSKFLLEQAKFCMDCGVKRLVL